jgi:hypothetical protein
MDTKPPVALADRTQWLNAFRRHALSDDTTRSTLKRAAHAVCTDVNLLGFLYAYVASPKLIFNARGRRRDDATDGLRGIAARLDRSAKATEKLLASPWWKGQSVADLLQNGTLRISGSAGTSDKRISLTGKLSPTFILEMPTTLRTQAHYLRWLGREVRRELATRKVGRTLYLAQLVVYWKELTGSLPKWKDVATLVDDFDILTWPLSIL